MWKTIQSFFSMNGLNCNKIFLSEKGRRRKDSVAVATTMNDYFVNITQSVELSSFSLTTLIIYSKII